MAQRRPTRKVLAALPLMFLAGWMPLFAAPLPLPLGPLDTNIFNTNGLVIPPDVQFLLRDLQTNLNQVLPFLAIVNGTNQADASQTVLPPAPQALPSTPKPADTNNAALIYGLGAALENVQTDLQELLPKLAAMVGQTNYSSNSVRTNNATIPNRLEPTDSIPARSPQIQRSRGPLLIPTPIFFFAPTYVEGQRERAANILGVTPAVPPATSPL